MQREEGCRRAEGEEVAVVVSKREKRGGGLWQADCQRCVHVRVRKNEATARTRLSALPLKPVLRPQQSAR